MGRHFYNYPIMVWAFCATLESTWYQPLSMGGYYLEGKIFQLEQKFWSSSVTLCIVFSTVSG